MNTFHCWDDLTEEIETRNLIYVDPSNIKYANDPGFIYKTECQVMSGNWDTSLPYYKDIFPYEAFEQRFIHDKCWKQTKLFDFINAKIVSGQTWMGCDTIDEVEIKLLELDKLYESIKNKGYHTQQEILESESKFPFGKPTTLPNGELKPHEISISIGRNGDLIFEDGRHRLAISKVLNLESIPVQVIVRHSEWQKLRKKVLQGTIDYPEKFTNHPDISYLYDKPV